MTEAAAAPAPAPRNQRRLPPGPRLPDHFQVRAPLRLELRRELPALPVFLADAVARCARILLEPSRVAGLGQLELTRSQRYDLAQVMAALLARMDLVSFLVGVPTVVGGPVVQRPSLERLGDETGIADAWGHRTLSRTLEIARWLGWIGPDNPRKDQPRKAFDSDKFPDGVGFIGLVQVRWVTEAFFLALGFKTEKIAAERAAARRRLRQRNGLPPEPETPPSAARKTAAGAVPPHDGAGVRPSIGSGDPEDPVTLARWLALLKAIGRARPDLTSDEVRAEAFRQLEGDG